MGVSGRVGVHFLWLISAWTLEPGGFEGQGEKATEEKPQKQRGMKWISLPVFTSHFFLGLRLAVASAELFDVY